MGPDAVRSCLPANAPRAPSALPCSASCMPLSSGVPLRSQGTPISTLVHTSLSGRAPPQLPTSSRSMESPLSMADASEALYDRLDTPSLRMYVCGYSSAVQGGSCHHVHFMRLGSTGLGNATVASTVLAASGQTAAQLLGLRPALALPASLVHC